MNEQEESRQLREELCLLQGQNEELRQVIETLREELARANQMTEALEDKKKEAPQLSIAARDVPPIVGWVCTTQTNAAGPNKVVRRPKFFVR